MLLSCSCRPTPSPPPDSHLPAPRPTALPYGGEPFDNYLALLAALPEISSRLQTGARGATLLAHRDKDFYIVGMKSYGRAPTFLLATGYEQVRSVAAALAGDLASS